MHALAGGCGAQSVCESLARGRAGDEDGPAPPASPFAPLASLEAAPSGLRRAASSPDVDGLLGPAGPPAGAALAGPRGGGSGGGVDRGRVSAAVEHGAFSGGAARAGFPGHDAEAGYQPPRSVRTPPRSEDGAGASTSGACRMGWSPLGESLRAVCR